MIVAVSAVDVPDVASTLVPVEARAVVVAAAPWGKLLADDFVSSALGFLPSVVSMKSDVVLGASSKTC